MKVKTDVRAGAYLKISVGPNEGVDAGSQTVASTPMPIPTPGAKA